MASAKPKKKNPRLASGRKRARQDVKLNEANSSLRSQYRTAVKNVEKAVLAGDKTKAAELFGKMQSIVDSIAREHGGRAEVENMNDGGARFTLVLPITPPAQEGHA